MEENHFDALKESRELDIDFHLLMLLCKSRMTSYRNAIFNHGAFKEKVVADVGSGTGILAIWSAQAGAKKVYAIEPNENYKLIEKAVKNNNLEDKIVVIKATAQEADLPEKVDIIISETMGKAVIGDCILPHLIAARDKWLKPDGSMFPNKAKAIIAPIADKHYYQSREQFILNFEHIYGVDFTHLLETFRKNASAKCYVKAISSDSIKSKAVVIQTIDFKNIKVDDCMGLQGNVSFKPMTTGQIHGFCIWFTAQFPTGEELDTGPIEHPTHWRQVLCFIDEPMILKKDVELEGNVTIRLKEIKRYQNLDISVNLAIEGKKQIQKSWELQYNHGQHIVSPLYEILP